MSRLPHDLENDLTKLDRSPSPELIAKITATRDRRLVPFLLPCLALDERTRHAAATAIETLLRDASPSALAQMDDFVRSVSIPYEFTVLREWRKLRPSSAATLARGLEQFPNVIGILASHPSGYFREAALEPLSTRIDGREIPYLALRANDWIDQVAAKATGLLEQRLSSTNREAVFTGIPFIIRTLGQRRQDHTRLRELTRQFLLADGARDALAHVAAYELRVRRHLYELLWTEAVTTDSLVLTAALADVDPIIRTRAVRQLGQVPDRAPALDVLQDVVVSDAVPAVRKAALQILADNSSERTGDLLPRVLLDRATRVRELARFLAKNLRSAIDPRELCLAALDSADPRTRATALTALGETASKADAGTAERFLRADDPRLRRAALVALARLDGPAVISHATQALTDAAPSVRRTAVAMLCVYSRLVDFDRISDRFGQLSDPRARMSLLTLIKGAPKWTAAVLLLRALGDADGAVRRRASRLLDVWMEGFNRVRSMPQPGELQEIRELLDRHEAELSRETARLFRFCIRP